MYVCICNSVTDGQIRKLVCDGRCASFEELQAETAVSTCCGKCRECALGCFQEARDETV